MPELSVFAVNLSQRLALMTDNSVREITNMFDAAGEDTEDPAAAVSCVVKNAEDSWFAVRLPEFERTTLQ